MTPLKHGGSATSKIHNMWVIGEISWNISLENITNYQVALISGMQQGIMCIVADYFHAVLPERVQT